MSEVRGSERAALALFDALVDLDPAACEARLAAADPAVAGIVRRWLAADAAHDARVTPMHYAALAQSATGADAVAGERIGAWALVREIGRGGMGSVWLAERAEGDFAQKTALKLIRRDLGASDAEARFRRERRILATLKHPNIAQLLDGGVTADGRPWLAMEWVEGRTLREALAATPLEPRRLLLLASEIASALAHAHAAGVVHRDLKPDNVMLAAEGYVKVLDFGVAKLVAGDEALAVGAETQPGRIIGTTPYMSPEQASGGDVDFRSDQFALGALLYEAATGRAAFARDTPAETVAAVLRDTPPFGTSLGTTVPDAFLRIVERCLAKDASQRYASTQDLARDFADLARGADIRPRRAHGGATGRASLAAGTLLLLAVALAGGWLAGRGASAPRDRSPLRTEVTIAPAERLWFHVFPLHAFALSRDARQLVFVGQVGAQRQLFLRDLATRETIALPGTDAPANPVFSPDGEWILFFGGGFELRKVPVRGGSSTLVAHAPNYLGGAIWPRDDLIVFSPNPGTGLWRVSPDGGEPVQITFPDFDGGEGSHVWPASVPDSDLLLYVAEIEAHDTFDAGKIYGFDPASGTRTLLVDGGSDPIVVDGMLHYARAGTIYAVAFDPDGPRVRGAPRPLFEGVAYSPATGAAQYSMVSGASVRLAGREGWDLIEPVVVDRAGNTEPLGLPPRMYARMQLAPDARRAVFQVTAADDDLWIYDFERRLLSRLTERDENIFPTFSHDGTYVYYTHHREPPPSIWRRRADGNDAPERLTEPEAGSLRAQLVHDATPDGRYVVFDQYLDSTNFDIGLYDLETDSTRMWLTTPARERGARVSPDGRWLAYVSDASGSDEIYVHSFDGGTRLQVSTGGGFDARWHPNGRELYYQLRGALYRVPLGDGPVLRPGPPEKLFEGDYAGAYDVFPDGRFLMRRRVREPGGAGPLLIDVD